ncbi:hypothetical protein Pr1d_33270 [Bythopirellula goksoeyrii]|uniref:Uncharacterized protein n=1 Tax=Bythopirellula goksoeyrii TaxID=1400387 RepID=A0A5B9QAT7_9BACT|nr:hypothetical protein Pr1d_33270 [Bythopirellula goksoeyrii]
MRCVGCFVLAAAFLAGDNSEASIIRPEMATFVLEDANHSQSSSIAAPADQPAPNPTTPDLHDLAPLHAMGTGGGSSSGSSSGSSTGSSPNSTLAVCSLSSPLLAGFILTGQVTSELHLSLPATPGTDLLRPPQAV